MKKRIFICLIFGLVTGSVAQTFFAQDKPLSIGKQNDKPEQSKISQVEQDRRLETFLIVWGTIKDNYFDETYSGLDWDKIKKEYEPKVKNSKTDAELNIILKEMISRLNRSHFGIIPPEVYIEFQRKKEEAKQISKQQNAEEEDFEEEDASDEDTEELDDSLYKYGTGLELRLIEGKFVITKIDKNSAAEKAGLKTGYILDKVNGVSLSEFVTEIRRYMSDGKSIEKKLAFLLVDEILSGEKDSLVSLTIINRLDNLEEFTLKRKKIEGQYVKVLSNVPDYYFRFETKSIDENIGYIKFNFFVIPVIEKFCSALTKFKDKKAIIIDLRGNMGGSFGSIIGLAGLLTDKNFNLGTEISRSGQEVRIIEPHLKNFKGEIVILIDDLSYSAAEIFTAAFQENGRAKVIGEKSAGEALPALTKILPTGAVFLFPIANFKTPKGNFLEGIGVKPDLEVSLSRNLLLNDRDNQLAAAVAVINQQLTVKQEQNNSLSKNLTQQKALSQNISTIKPPKSIIKKIKNIQDPKALKIIDDYLEAVGGRETLNSIKSFRAVGTVELARNGALVEGTGGIYWISPNKFSEIYEFSSIGEVKEVFDGQNYFVQSKFTSIENFNSPLLMTEKKLSSNFFELLQIKNIYPQIFYRGTFRLEDKDIEIIETKTPEGFNVAFGFDAASKMLFKRTSQFSDTTFEDYKKAGKILFPYTISKGTVLKYRFRKIDTNIDIAEEIFKKEQNCFDIVD